MDVDSKKEEKVERGHSSNSVFTVSNDEDYEDYDEVDAILDGDANNEDTEIRCRFCWNSAADKDNPLLVYCLCAGSVRYIHFSCLQAWLNTRRQEKTSPNFSTYFWKAFECEICKKAYPLTMKNKDTMYNLVKYDRPSGDYMVLESLSQEKNTSRIIHIIKPSQNKNEFKLGRGHESDLRINDISVSRCHAKIKLVKGKFMLEDNTSKFGTLVLVKQRTPLLSLYNKAVQIGRTVINFSVKANNSSTGLVSGESKKNKQINQQVSDSLNEQHKQFVPQAAAAAAAASSNQDPVQMHMAATNGFNQPKPEENRAEGAMNNNM